MQWNIIPYNLCPQMASPDHIDHINSQNTAKYQTQGIYLKVTWDIENFMFWWFMVIYT